jgi:hypothetical protein
MANTESKAGWKHHLQPDIAVWVPLAREHEQTRSALQRIKDDPDAKLKLATLGMEYGLPYLDIYPFELDPESHGGEVGIAIGSDAARLSLSMDDWEYISSKVTEILQTQVRILIHPQFSRLPQQWNESLGSIPPSRCIISDNAIIVGGRQ